MSTFFTSDQHFEHKRVIELCSRPFRDLDHMREELIQRYNARVGIYDEVYWLGDAFFGRGSDLVMNQLTMGRLQGKKYLIKGNHDRMSTIKLRSLGFEEVYSSMLMPLGKRMVVLKHSPAVYTDHPIDFQLHGHTHTKLKRSGKLIHVGVDAWDYTPVSRDEIIKLMEEE